MIKIKIKIKSRNLTTNHSNWALHTFAASLALLAQTAFADVITPAFPKN